MQKVLIDKFIVPEESRAEFLKAVQKSAGFVRTLPGYVEGFIYEKTDGDGPHNVVTMAVWEDEESFASARKSAKEEFQKHQFDPQEIMKALKVTIERAIYHRTPY